MTRTITKRVTVMLLALAMVFTMMPYVGGMAYATDEYYVSTDAELKAKLEGAEYEGATIIALGNIVLDQNVTVQGTKTLQLNGTIGTSKSINVSDGANLTINGSGTITEYSSATDLICCAGSGNVTINGGNFINTSTDRGAVVWINAGTGKLTINGGYFAQTGEFQVFHSQVQTGDAYTVEINGGEFVALNSGSASYVWGTTTNDITKVILNGGTFVGKISVFSFATNNIDASDHTDKKVGAGKVMYIDGAKYEGTALDEYSINNSSWSSKHYFVQVGSASDFVQVALETSSADANGLASMGGKCTTSGYFLKNKNMYLMATNSSKCTFSSWERVSGAGSFGDTTAATTTFAPTEASTVRANYTVPQKYTITINQTGAGSYECEKTEAVAGEAVILTPTPADGNLVKSVTVTDADGANVATRAVSGSTTAVAWNMPAKNVTVDVVFAKAYTISVSSPIEHGTITADKAQACKGDTVKVSVTPDEGYRLKANTLSYAYQIGGNPYVSYIDADGEITMPAANITVNAVFEKIPEYTVNVAEAAHGTVTVDKTGKVKAGETVTIHTKPDTNYKPASIKVTCGSDNVPLDVNDTEATFTMPEGDATVSVTFAAIDYVNIYKSASTGGTVQISKTGSTASISKDYPGATINVKATSDDKYYLESLKLYKCKDDGGELAPGDFVQDIEGSFTLPEYDVYVVAVFKPYEEITVTTAAELRVAFEKETPVIITLGGDIECISGINAKGIKILNGANHKITFTSHALDFRAATDIQIDNVQIEGSTEILMTVGSAANVVINGGTFISTSEIRPVFWVNAGTGKLTINDGTFLNTGSYEVFHSQVETGDAYTVEINDGLFAALNDGSNCYVWGSPHYDITRVRLNGGTFIGKVRAFSFSTNNRDASDHQNKKIGSGKVMYIDGKKYEGTALDEYSMGGNSWSSNNFVQVGNSSDFVWTRIFYKGSGNAFLCTNRNFNDTTCYALKNEPVLVRYNSSVSESNIEWKTTNGKFDGTVAGYRIFIPTDKDATINVNFKTGSGIFDTNPKRIYGSSRYETSIKLADAYKTIIKQDKVDNVVVAYGGNYPDALAGGYVATEKNAPLITVDTTVASETAVYNWIKANMKSEGTVYILGGTGVVTSRFEETLSKNGIKPERYAGASRFDTNMEVLNKVGTHGELLICSAYGYADSLGASATGEPIMLVGPNLTEAQKKFISDNGITRIYVIGGEGAVSKAVFDEAKALCYDTKRVAGSNRYDTSIEVAKVLVPTFDTAVAVYGQNFPDGLSAGPVAHALGAPLLLVTSDAYKPQAKFIKDNGFSDRTDILVVGGPALISDVAANALAGK